MLCPTSLGVLKGVYQLFTPAPREDCPVDRCFSLLVPPLMPYFFKSIEINQMAFNDDTHAHSADASTSQFFIEKNSHRFGDSEMREHINIIIIGYDT